MKVPKSRGGGKISPLLSGEQVAYLVALSDEWNMTPAGALRRVLEEKRSGAPAVGEEKPLSKQEKFFLQVRERFEVDAAARDAGLSAKELEKLLGVEAHLERVELEQSAYLADVQEDLRRIGTGSLKGGNAIALMAVLNAHHPDYGRVKQEMISRAIDPLMRQLLKMLIGELGEKNEEAVRGIFEKFSNQKDLRLSDFT